MFSNELSLTFSSSSNTMLNHTSTENATNATNRLQMYNDFMFTHHLLPSFIYLILLLIVGIPGNIFVCFYYLTRGRHYDTNRNRHTTRLKIKASDIFILSLASFDLISCSFAMPIELVLLKSYAMFDRPNLCKFSRFVSMFCTTSTSFVLVAIAVSRFFGIRLRKHIKALHAKILVGALVVIAIIISVPMIPLYGTYSFNLPGLSEPAHTCLISNKYAKSDYPLIVTIILSAFHVTFDVLFFCLYVLISCKVVHTQRNMSSVARRDTRQPRQEGDVSLQEDTMAHPGTSNEDHSLNLQPFVSKSTDDVFSKESKFTKKQHGKESHLVGPVRGRICSKRSDQNKYFSRSFKRSTKLSRRGSEISVHGRVYNAGQTTFMMFIVTLAFMVSFAPYCVIAIIRNISSADNYSTLKNSEKSLYQIFLRSYFLSSAVNPIIYNVMNRDFRCRFKTLLKSVFKTLCVKSKAEK